MTAPWLDEDGDERWGEPWDDPGWPRDGAGPEYWLYLWDAEQEVRDE